MAPFQSLLEEVNIAWAFTYRDFTATVVPFSFFTIASSLEAGSSYETLLINTSKCALLSFLLLYTFTISNQINGIEEDKINKPDRPIVSGRVTLQGAYARYGIFTLGCFLLAFAMGVEIGATTFMVLGALHNFTNISSFGPGKDSATTGILTSGLYTAWVLGGGDQRRGINWIACLSISLLFTISIQDLRDVIGDAASGRYTTPWMLGKPYGKPVPLFIFIPPKADTKKIDRVYIGICMLAVRAITLTRQYLEGGNLYSSRICAALVVLADVFLVARMFRLQSIPEDKKTYRFYMLRFSFETLLASFILAA
ncbi:hypothetical protein V492_02849 [Pseudogymnoascus sp. VKM F-4246]|nr:hypothetical protein V492_02849 [Pseudogymnoascus sp. VKM F-4246]